jgi:hypothetical protein
MGTAKREDGSRITFHHVSRTMTEKLMAEPAEAIDVNAFKEEAANAGADGETITVEAAPGSKEVGRKAEVARVNDVAAVVVKRTVAW